LRCQTIAFIGPLGKLLRELEKAKEQPIDTSDLDKLLLLVQQAVLVLWPGTRVSPLQPKANVLARFFADNRKADKLFQKNRDKLFGGGSTPHCTNSQVPGWETRGNMV
jgi:hypothetical protein